MLFFVYPGWDCEKCEEKILPEYKKVNGIRIDERCVSKPENIPAHKGESTDWWYREGKNHRVKNNHIQRDFEEEFYVIELSTIEDLLNFQKKYKTTASISYSTSNHVYNGENLKDFYHDYFME